MKKKPGYILVMTLLLLSLATVIVTKLYVQARTYTAFSMLDVKRQQARCLAESGISIALAQLTLHDQTLKPKENKEKVPEKQNDQQTAQQKERQLLKTLLLTQNRWQTFVLTYDNDGIDATLHVCISCEDGKLNLNKIWDFKNKKFSSALVRAQDAQKLFTTLGTTAAPLLNNKNIVEPLLETLKKRQQPLFDVTELLTNEKLWEFKDAVFFEPPINDLKASSEGQKQEEKIFLTDLFTIWTDEETMYPLLMSSSLRTLCKFSAQVVPTKELVKEIGTISEKISLDNSAWAQDWNTYAKPLFGKDFAHIPQEIIPFLSSKFEPRVFSVLCYAEVGTVKQKLLAILERSRVEKGEKFKVKKLYWI